MSQLAPLVFELHTDVQGGKPGLIGAYGTADNATFQAIHGAYGDYGANYSRNFRGGNLGGPSRGLSLIELQGSPGRNFTPEQVSAAANKLYGTLMSVDAVKSGKRPLHFFAGHGDVTSGETGAPGEKAFVKAVKLKMQELSANNKNFHYHLNSGDHIASADDPNSNWSRGAAILRNWKPGEPGNTGGSTVPATVTSDADTGDNNTNPAVNVDAPISQAKERAVNWKKINETEDNPYTEFANSKENNFSQDYMKDAPDAFDVRNQPEWR